MLLASRYIKKLEELLNLYTDLDSVTKHFQAETTNLAEVIAILNQKIEDYASTQARLSPTASIFLHSKFEAAFLKVQDLIDNNLSTDEKQAISKLMKIKSTKKKVNFKYMPLAKRVIAKRQEHSFGSI